MKPKILIIDDELEMLKTLEIILKRDFDVIITDDPLKLEEIIDTKNPHVVITDMKMDKRDGIDIIKTVITKYNLPIILITAYATVESAIKALKLGVIEYIIKPFSRDDIVKAINKALSKIDWRNLSSYKEIKKKYNLTGLIGISSNMIRVFDAIKRVSNTDSTVLIMGESGVGKNLIAKNIHINSNRRDKPFITVNLASIPGTLFESELFGFEKGAFTGADKSKPGKVELADGGTLFLDEVGELPLHTQPKILHLLQDKEISRIGAKYSKKVNIRLIAATNQDIEHMIKEKKFREDLYYRLNVFPIYIPPLRERKEDIPLLSRYFIQRLSKEKGLDFKPLTHNALNRLCDYNWPGNVRELINVLERALIVSNDEITIDDLWLSSKNRDVNLKSLSEIEREHIKRVLIFTNNNKKRSAEILEIDRSTLYRLIKKYGL